MKIRISATVDVDPDAWAESFGIEKSQVPEDVKTYFEVTIREQLDRLGLARAEAS